MRTRNIECVTYYANIYYKIELKTPTTIMYK